MEFVKDLLLVILFVMLIIKNAYLYALSVRQRNYFIDTLNHDLKVATIAQIRGLEFLEKQYSHELVQEIMSSSKFSLEMINMLINTYKYEKGEQVLNRETFELKDLLNGISKSLVDKVKQKGIELSFKCDKYLHIFADKEKMYKLLLVLISVAISNADKNSTVYVICKNKQNSFKCSVVYSGKSLSEEEYRRMFLKKPRFSTVGQGIKLQLCKKIVDFHKGQIYIKKCAENLNSFTFTIPNKAEKTSFKPINLSQLQVS